MEDNQQQLEALQDIRQMMKQSNRFLSLSGFSGIFAGVYALAGAYLGHIVISDFINEYSVIGFSNTIYKNMLLDCILICAGVLGLSLLTALYFSKRKAHKHGYKLFDHTAWRLMINLLVPLATGGIFCLALLYHGSGMVGLISPVMLIFYGLALVNGSKYTLNDIRYLGYLEILLGIIASFNVGCGLVFWSIGFGLLHIIYGTIMWFKYERG
jgi:hypothetical protein